MGKVKYNDGSWYEGDVKNGLPNGRGTVHYVNGEKYEGEMKENEFHGYGTFGIKITHGIKVNFTMEILLEKER